MGWESVLEEVPCCASVGRHRGALSASAGHFRAAGREQPEFACRCPRAICCTESASISSAGKVAPSAGGCIDAGGSGLKADVAARPSSSSARVKERRGEAMPIMIEEMQAEVRPERAGARRRRAALQVAGCGPAGRGAARPCCASWRCATSAACAGLRTRSTSRDAGRDLGQSSLPSIVPGRPCAWRGRRMCASPSC
jgi:hypothetical protein